MKTRYSKTKDNLIVLVASLFLAVVLVGGFNYAGFRYPWLQSTEGIPNEYRRTLRSYAEGRHGVRYHQALEYTRIAIEERGPCLFETRRLL